MYVCIVCVCLCAGADPGGGGGRGASAPPFTQTSDIFLVWPTSMLKCHAITRVVYISLSISYYDEYDYSIND